MLFFDSFYLWNRILNKFNYLFMVMFGEILQLIRLQTECKK
jgi:hypothetical protein